MERNCRKRTCECFKITELNSRNTRFWKKDKYDYDKKNQYKEDKEIQEEIEKLEKEFAGNGRVLIRPSGTEPLIRVMIEGENQEYIKEKAERLAKLIEEKLN